VELRGGDPPGPGRSSRLSRTLRRSIAMLPVGAPALNRDEALEILGQLVEALSELRRRDIGGSG
jgi:hypothetical protein